MAAIKRQTAYKCTIFSILSNQYIHKEGWEPSYVNINGIQVSRVNLLAVLVAKNGNSMTLDDSTGKINVMLFTEPERADNLKVGDVLLMIGKVRDYNNARYIVPEIMRIVQERNWIDYRKKELELLGMPNSLDTHKEISISEKNDEEMKIDDNIELDKPGENFSGIVLETIKRLDKGDGANTDEVIKESKVKDAEKHIMTLLYEGEIFEIRPGKLKVLE